MHITPRTLAFRDIAIESSRVGGFLSLFSLSSHHTLLTSHFARDEPGTLHSPRSTYRAPQAVLTRPEARVTRRPPPTSNLDFVSLAVQMASASPPPPPDPNRLRTSPCCGSSSSSPPRNALRRSKTVANPESPLRWRREPLVDVTNLVLGRAGRELTGRLQVSSLSLSSSSLYPSRVTLCLPALCDASTFSGCARDPTRHAPKTAILPRRAYLARMPIYRRPHSQISRAIEAVRASQSAYSAPGIAAKLEKNNANGGSVVIVPSRRSVQQTDPAHVLAPKFNNVHSVPCWPGLADPASVSL